MELKGLQTNVRMTIEMIEVLDKQVKAGKVSLEEAQEEVKEAILGKKDANGKRPINPRLNLGENGFIFIINSQQGLNSHTRTLKGRMYGILKTTDGVYSTQEVVKAANKGGGFVTYEWPLPNNPECKCTENYLCRKRPKLELDCMCWGLFT